MHQISNTKRKCYFKDSKTYENKFGRLNNIAGQFKQLKSCNFMVFIQKSFKLTNNTDDNFIDCDLPSAMLFDLKMLFLTLNNKLMLFFDKTYNCAIYHLLVITFLSQRVLKKTRAKAQMFEVFFSPQI